MIIHDIADYLVNLTKSDIKPDIYSVFDLPGENYVKNRCPENIESEKLTILEILNAIGCRLKNLFGFVKINTTTETIDEGDAVVNVSGDVDALNFDFKLPRGKDGPPGPKGAPGVSVTVGNTTTLPSGESASVTNSGTDSDPVLNFAIPQGATGPAGPDNLIIITATASTTAQGEYTPNVAYSEALANIQTNKAVIIKIENAAGRYYMPYSASNSEILASAGTVSGSNQSIELYTLKWTAATNIITLTGTKEGCTADGGTKGQVLAKKSNESFDTEWVDAPPVVQISDTADANKTAADGWAASPAAIAETQTSQSYTNSSAVSGANLITSANYVTITGKNVDIYIGITTSTAFYGTTVISNLPMPNTSYTLATFVDGNGNLNGFGWVNNGNIRAPTNLPTGTWYIIAHYTMT